MSIHITKQFLHEMMTNIHWEIKTQEADNVNQNKNKNNREGTSRITRTNKQEAHVAVSDGVSVVPADAMQPSG